METATAINPIQRVSGGVDGLSPIDKTEFLSNLIYTNSREILNIRNKVSTDHDRLIRFLSGALAAQCLSPKGYKTRGRFAYDIDTGLGKSVSVLSLIKSIYQLQLDTSLIVANGQIAENCKIIRQLIAMGVPESCIGICHSREVSPHDDVLIPATHPSLRSSKQFLFICHARFEISAFRKEMWLNQYNTYRGKDRTLVIYDESIKPSLPVAVDYAACTNLKKHIETVEGPARPDEKRVLSALSRQAADVQGVIERSAKALKRTGEKQVVDVTSVIDGKDHEKLQAILYSPKFFGDQYKRYTETARALLLMCGYSCRLVHTSKTPDKLTPGACGLTRYLVIIPPELDNICVLDANYTADKLVAIDKSITKHVGFTQNAVDHVKRYDSLKIHRANLNAGKGRLCDEWAKFAVDMTDEERAADTYRNACVSKFLEDTSIPTIFVAHKNIPTSKGNMHFSQVLDAELDYYGVPKEVRKKNVHVVTWNSHTGSNHLSHCRRVIFCSMFNMPLITVAFQALATSQDLLFDFSSHCSVQHMKAMVKVCYAYQAMSRCCIRNVLVDILGNTQAQAAEVWMADEHDKDVLDEQLKDNLLIGCSIDEWDGVGQPPSKAETWRKQVKEYLQERQEEWAGKPVVFKTKDLKAVYPELNKLTKSEGIEFSEQCKGVLTQYPEWTKKYQTWTYKPFFKDDSL